MDRVDEMKHELAQLEGKSAPAEPTTKTAFERVFDYFFSDEYRQLEEQKSKDQADAINRVSKVCGNCYFTQAVIETACQLCGFVPVMWLPAAEHPPNPEMEMLREMAAHASVQDIQIALRSGWCARLPERQRVAENLLAARIHQRDVREIRESVYAAHKAHDQPPKERESQGPLKELQEINERIAKLKASAAL